MSIDRIHGEVVFTCDDCDDTLETGRDDFAEALTVLRAEGWRSDLVAGDWTHTCPDCIQPAQHPTRSSPADFQ